jgi:hypothetical protein
MLHPSITLEENSRLHGKGLVATAEIQKGETVWRFDDSSQRLSLNDIEEWDSDSLWEFSVYAYQIGEDEYVFPKDIDKYMNHSCDPNSWGDEYTLVARRDIHPGEEVTYDYSTSALSPYFSMMCNCGARICRKTITSLDYLDPPWQEIYGRNLPSYTLQRIERVKRSRKYPMLRSALVLLRMWFRLKRFVSRHTYLSRFARPLLRIWFRIKSFVRRHFDLDRWKNLSWFTHS